MTYGVRTHITHIHNMAHVPFLPTSQFLLSNNMDVLKNRTSQGPANHVFLIRATTHQNNIKITPVSQIWRRPIVNSRLVITSPTLRLIQMHPNPIYRDDTVGHCSASGNHYTPNAGLFNRYPETTTIRKSHYSHARNMEEIGHGWN